jgi:hypothetical protein
MHARMIGARLTESDLRANLMYAMCLGTDFAFADLTEANTVFFFSALFVFMPTLPPVVRSQLTSPKAWFLPFEPRRSPRVIPPCGVVRCAIRNC